jgi:hypothetical protein
MPPAIIAVGGAVLAGSAAYSAGIVIFGAALIAPGLAAAVVAGVGVLAVGFVSTALTPKAKAPDVSSFERQAQDNILTVRQAAAPRRVAFGRVRVGGVYTFLHTTGTDNNTLHSIVTVTGHPVRSLDALYLDDEVVPLDSNGDATGKYAGKVSVKFGLGTTAGDSAFHAALTAAVGSMWTADHLQAGCAKAYVKFVYGSDLFGGGLPNPSFVVSGYVGVEDPRVGTSPVTTGWMDNAALCIAQYMRDTARGMGYASDGIDEDALIAAANDCDEMVSRIEAAVAFTADATSNILTVADTSAKLRTGTRFQASNAGGSLPGGLSAATNYFWIPLTPTTGKAATSLANSRAGTAVDITSAGTGTHTLTVDAEPRYTLNGWFDTSEEPESLLPRLLSAMAGVKTETGGKVVLLAGVWRGATETIADSDLDGQVVSAHRRSRKDLFNGIKGTFVNPDDDWQPTDFPAVAPAAYLTEDGNERIWKDAALPYTDSPSMAQRIVRIDLEQTRRQQSATIPLNLKGMKHRAGDTVSVTNTKRGWSAKTFFISKWGAEPRGDAESLRIGTTVDITETDASVFAWMPATDEAQMTASPLTNLPDPFAATAPDDLVLSSGTAVLGVRLDGTVFSRIKVAWTAPLDAQVTSGGTIEVEYKKSAAATWRSGGAVRGDETEAFILDVDDGEAYDVRIRSRRGGALRAASDWVTESNHTVVGKTAPPSDVATLSANQNGITVNFVWSQIGDADLAGYEIRYMTAPFVWESAAVLTRVTRGTRITTAAVQPSPLANGGPEQAPWVFGIKAVDTSGNYSETEATKRLVVTNAFTVIADSQQWPLWTGTRDGWVRNPTTGNLNPSSDDSAATVEDFFAAYAANPPAESVYTTAEIDIGLDVAARVWTEANANVGPGEAGSADPTVEIDYHEAAGAYDGFESWAVGDATLRTAKGRVTIDQQSGASRLTGFNVTIDSQSRKETGTVVMSASPAGAMPVTFATPFASAPDVRVFPAGGTPRIGEPSAVTGTGFTALLWDLSGNPVNDTIEYEAEGV